MADVTNEFLAEMLWRIEADIGELKTGIRDIRTRLEAPETGSAGMSTGTGRRDETPERVARRPDRPVSPSESPV